MKKICFFLLLCFAPLVGFAQIQLGETNKKSEVVCGIYRLGILVNSYISRDSKGYFIVFPLGPNENVNSDFYLGAEESAAKQAFKSLIDAFNDLNKGDSFDVKDFLGHPYIISKTTKSMGTITDCDISVQNGFGAKYNQLEGKLYIPFYQKLYDKWTK